MNPKPEHYGPEDGAGCHLHRTGAPTAGHGSRHRSTRVTGWHASAVSTHYTPLLLFLLFLGATLVSPPRPTAAQPADPGNLEVDFTNRESRSISLRLGSDDGITADMNFAVIDSAGRQVTEFYPMEILKERFWSGPLERDDFSRVSPGNPVVRIELTGDEAVLLRERFRERVEILKEERRLRRIELLREERSEVAEEINDLDVRSVRFNRDLESLQDKLRREKDLTGRRMEELRDQIDELREERSELVEERKDLLDNRDRLLRRNDPPQERISDLNESIADLDREIGRYNLEIEDLRDQTRDLREGATELEEEIREVRDEQRALDRERDELKRELEDISRQMDKLETMKSHR